MLFPLLDIYNDIRCLYCTTQYAYSLWVHQSSSAWVSLQPAVMYDNVDIFEWIKFNKFVDVNILLLWKEKHEKSVYEWHGDHIISCSTLQRTKVKRYIKSSNSIKEIQILCSTFTIEQYKIKVLCLKLYFVMFVGCYDVACTWINAECSYSKCIFLQDVRDRLGLPACKFNLIHGCWIHSPIIIRYAERNGMAINNSAKWNNSSTDSWDVMIDEKGRAAIAIVGGS